MKTVTLNNGVEMPVLGLGTYKTTDPSECLTSVRDALELGYRMIDTAQFYDNEEFVARRLPPLTSRVKTYSSPPKYGRQDFPMRGHH